MDPVPLQSKFFPAKFFFCILEKGILAGKKSLCKEGYSDENVKILRLISKCFYNFFASDNFLR